MLCVFNSTPLEKYESYRQCIDRWREEHAAPDLAPTFYNLVDALARFLRVDTYAAHNGTQPVYLVDRMPEVYNRPSEEAMCKLLERKGADEEETKEILTRITSGGSCYLPRMNAIFVREFQMVGGAEEAARFVHHACRPPSPLSEVAASSPEEKFYASVVEHALGYFGSRVLYPARPAVRGFDLGVQQQCASDGEKLGYVLGSQLYDAYVAGGLSKRYIRTLFFRKLNGPAACSTYLQIARKVRAPRGKTMA